eukprot:TRINITY_DN27837_c0_g1_i1.p1 TRINITY_DN27837_c0_g1~~TRINITY_DN27837_c0_g1_i1.p1  ORF type:complete len:235 (-),score=48.31 TRINITY_DN27837_c0_g1_i1:57-761(-)
MFHSSTIHPKTCSIRLLAAANVPLVPAATVMGLLSALKKALGWESSWSVQYIPPSDHKPSEGFMRANLTSNELNMYLPASPGFLMGGTHRKGFQLMTAAKARSVSRSSQDPCMPFLLDNSFERLKRALANAQLEAFYHDKRRFLELQRAEDLIAFLNRSDKHRLKEAEVSRLGKAMAAIQNAGRGARMDYTAQLRRSEEQVPNSLSDSISLAQEAMRDVVAFGFRCRATTFLMI